MSLQLNKEENKIELTIDLDNVTNIINFGNEVMQKTSEYTKKMSDTLNLKINNLDIIGSLNKVLKDVDYKELNKLNDQTKKPVLKLLGVTKYAKDKLINKYNVITKNIDNMYTGIKNYQSTINNTTDALNTLKIDTEDAKCDIKGYIEFGKEVIDSLSNDTKADIEKKNMLSQKVQDLQYSLEVSKQTIESINIMLLTNYEISKKLVSVYNTTLPIIQSQLNIFKVLKEQSQIIHSIQLIEDKRNEIIKISSSEAIKISKKSVEILGYTKEDFEVVSNSIKTLQDGLLEIIKYQEDKSSEISNMLKGGDI